MKKLLLAAFAAAALALSATAQELGETIPTVTVNGSAQMKITPDVLYLNITLDESDTKGKVSLEEQRRNMFSVLKKIGIDAEKQLRVLDMSSSFFRKRGKRFRIVNTDAESAYPLRVERCPYLYRLLSRNPSTCVVERAIAKPFCIVDASDFRIREYDRLYLV